ncbi:hypothetical protein F5I97DRAFT_1803831, partial [Phlebopus sp. FC_14]
LVFLSPYSLDYNLIEQAFSTIKVYLQHHTDDFSMTMIAHACQSISLDKAEGYFRVLEYII